MLRPLTLAALSLATAACALPDNKVGSVSTSEEVERPDFRVTDSAAVPGFDRMVELRAYEPVIVAETTVTAPNRDAASSRGFETLAAFIFGKNRPGEGIAMTAPVTTARAGQEIAMTAPVTTVPDAEGRYTVRFTMPAKYTMETLPRPIDPAVTIRPLPARRLVALRFTGQPSPDRVAAAERAIASFIASKGLKPSGPTEVAGYDGPNVSMSRQRWEVHQSVG